MSATETKIGNTWIHAIFALCVQIAALTIFLFGGYVLSTPFALALVALFIVSLAIDLIIYVETREQRLDIFERGSEKELFERGSEKEYGIWGKEYTKSQRPEKSQKGIEIPPPPPELMVHGKGGLIMCPICRSWVGPETKFCPSCGTRLAW